MMIMIMITLATTHDGPSTASIQEHHSTFSKQNQTSFSMAFQLACPIESVLSFRCSSIFAHLEKKQISIPILRVVEHSLVEVLSRAFVHSLPAVDRRLRLEPDSSDRILDRSLGCRILDSGTHTGVVDHIHRFAGNLMREL